MQTHFGTLDQWRALQAVVDHGGYAQAAQQLFRSQSTVNYAVSRLEKQLGMKLLEVHGRKAKLTEPGKVLLARSRQLLNDANEISQLASNLTQGREAEINLVVDSAFPMPILIQALKKFAPNSKGTRVQLMEVILSGADEALESGNADLVIAGNVPSDFLGNLLLDVEFIAVAHTEHKLNKLQRKIIKTDLGKSLQVVIRDSGIKHNTDYGWLGAEQRWTVSSLDSALAVVTAGLGFGWLPRHLAQKQIDSGELKILPLSEGQQYFAHMHLILGKPSNVGPATKELADILCNCANDL